MTFPPISLQGFLDAKAEFANLNYTQRIEYIAFFHVKLTGRQSFTTDDLVELYNQTHLPKPQNIPDLVNKLAERQIFIDVPEGYVLNRTEYNKLDSEFAFDKPKVRVSQELQSLLSKIKNIQSRVFLQEAIDCYQANLRRSSVIMTWLLTLDQLQHFVFSNKLADFNAELFKTNSKSLKVSSFDEFNEMKESQFLDICRAAAIITKEEYKLLKEKLDFRNTCSHPNAIVISEAKATSYIEDLVNNILVKYV